MIWLTLVFASLLSVAGQLCQKQATCFAAVNKRRKHIVLWLGLALACLGLAMVLWLLVLQNVPVGIAYPMLSLNFVWVTLAAVKLWHEPGIAASLVWGGVHYWRHCDPREYGVMGLMWGLFSVIIASAAQLSMGFAASHLPPMTHLWDFIAALLAFGLDARILLLGLLGYLLSVFCWYKTLHKLALSKAYALLSMSYVLVWIASMVLPGWEGTFSLKALLGVACIMSGLMLIFLPTTKQRY